MRKFAIALVALLTMALPSWAAKRIALVIGNSNYEHVIDLKNPTSDADLMERTLKEVGFEVMRFSDLDQRGMKQAMLSFGRKLKEGAEASMFYYAGHGIEIGGVNYLVPRDADLQSSEETDIQNVSVNSFLALTENSNVPLNIVILDACRNNPFRSLRGAGTGGLAPVKAPRGTYVAYATSPGAVAVDGDSVNSPFTQALAESMRQPGLTLEAVLKLTRSKVQTATNGAQLPFDSSAITGDFYFVPALAQEPQPVAPAPAAPQPADVAQQAYEAAGDNPDMLRVVIEKFSGSVWAALATEKLKRLSNEVPGINPTPPPAKTVEPEPAPQPDLAEPPVEPKVAAPEPVEAAPTEAEAPKVAEPPKVVEPVVETPKVAEPESVVEPKVVAPKPRPPKKVVLSPPPRVKVVKPYVRKVPPVVYVPPPKVKRRVVIAPRPPRFKPVAVAPKPVARVGVRCNQTAALRKGAMCISGDGRVCRVQTIRFGNGGGRPVLFGCR